MNSSTPPKMEFDVVSVRLSAQAARRGPRHENVPKYGTVFNTVAPGTQLTGVLHRRIASP